MGAAHEPLTAPAQQLLAELVQSLHEESDALIAGDADRLARCASRKNEILNQLAPALKSTPASFRAHLDKVVRQAQYLNDRNAQLLAPRIALNRARLDTLMNAGQGALGQNTFYGADGNTAGSGGVRASTQA